MSVVLELRHVSKRFGSHQAVTGVSLTVERGSLYALLGPSGCGKTTTLRMIAGFEEPDSGEILLNGSPLQHLRPYQRPVSTVFQNYALFPHLTARSNIEFGLKRKGTEPSVMARKVSDVLDMLQLTSRAERYPSELSGGEKQRVALARSLVVEPEVLLLDEPLSALDPNLRKQVRLELKALQKRVGTTFIFVTHDQDEALSMSDWVAVMNNGSVEQAGSPEELYVRPKTRFVANFLGAVNWIGKIGVRPELTKLSRSAPANGATSVPGVVGMSTFLGSCVHVHVTLSTGACVTAEVPREEANYQPGEKVQVWWRSGDELAEWKA